MEVDFQAVEQHCNAARGCLLVLFDCHQKFSFLFYSAKDSCAAMMHHLWVCRKAEKLMELYQGTTSSASHACVGTYEHFVEMASSSSVGVWFGKMHTTQAV